MSHAFEKAMRAFAENVLAYCRYAEKTLVDHESRVTDLEARLADLESEAA